jgi:hypothetical protein
VGATHAAHAHREADGHDVEEARELELALGDHCAVAVGYVERFNPQVRQLRERLAGREVLTARFTRYNARPSADVLLDLQSHDIDLARVLGVDPAGVIYNSLAGAAEIRREIQVQWSSARAVGTYGFGKKVGLEHADLTDHTSSPLHAQWHALLSGRSGCATPQDAIAVLEAIERRRPLALRWRCEARDPPARERRQRPRAPRLARRPTGASTTRAIIDPLRRSTRS